MKKLLALVVLSVAIPALAYSQETREYWVRPLSEANLAALGFDLANTDLAGEVIGSIKTADGKQVAGAMVVINNGFYFSDATSNKKGEYRVKGPSGNYTLEVSVPGCEKYVAEIVISRKHTVSYDVVLNSDVKASKKGNKALATQNNILFTINGKHPAYEGKSFYDVLVNLPLFDFSNGGLKVASSDNVTMHFNSRVNKAQPQMLVNMLRSIPAEGVQSVKVASWGGQGKNPMMVYLHYKE